MLRQGVYSRKPLSETNTTGRERRGPTQGLQRRPTAQRTGAPNDGYRYADDRRNRKAGAGVARHRLEGAEQAPLTFFRARPCHSRCPPGVAGMSASALPSALPIGTSRRSFPSAFPGSISHRHSPATFPGSSSRQNGPSAWPITVACQCPGQRPPGCPACAQPRCDSIDCEQLRSESVTTTSLSTALSHHATISCVALSRPAHYVVILAGK